ncbi:MAG: hypothetical protein HYX94_08455 [Chloroflexi bacterium]|nr:hypothetical protein [Chloroflexota bacterium]
MGAWVAFGREWLPINVRQASLPPGSRLQAVTGAAPAVATATNSWKTHRNQKIGLTLRYPPTWKLVEDPGQTALDLYPPNADPDLPWPHIAVAFAADQPYPAEPAPVPGRSLPQRITVGGVAGRQTEDTGYAVPTSGIHIEVPYRKGTLTLSAPKGPSVNLLPQFQEILKTVVIQP